MNNSIKDKANKSLQVAKNVINRHIATPDFLKKNLFRIAFLIVIGIILLQKDCGFSIALQTPKEGNNTVVEQPIEEYIEEPIVEDDVAIEHETEEQNPIIVIEDNGEAIEVNTADFEQEFDEDVIVNEGPRGDPIMSMLKEYIEDKIAKMEEHDNIANNFGNVGFILNPSYAKKNKIPDAVVEEKLQICKAYVDKFSPVAISEMEKYGIPASITLAQGLLESDAGASRLAQQANNHFGVKCFSNSCKPGHCKNFTDDTHKDFFRTYDSPWESYRAHSLFLQRKRYKHLKDLGKSDYERWAKGLSKAGYATDKKYAPKLIRLIESLGLSQYDS